MRTEPPFGGTKACPMCPGVARNFSATVHNFLVRYRRGDYCAAAAKYHDVLRARDALEDSAVVLHADLGLLVEAVNALEQSMISEGIGGAAIDLAVKLVETAYRPVEVLSELHFADRKHSLGIVQ